MTSLTLSESFGRIITEGVESKNMRLAKHYLYDKKGMDEPTAMRTLGALKTDIPNVRLAKCKFILGVTRLYCDGELSEWTNISLLNRYLRYIASNAHINEYDNNLNGYSFDKLDERFGTIAAKDLEAEKNAFSKQEFSLNNEYDIVVIDSFEDASKYSQYTDWCVTYDSTMYDDYTSGGLGRFYFCLKKGFENVEDVPSDNCPLDEYGLSMIATSVNSDGSCNTITCRWNHKNDGNDHIMTTKELSELIGRNYYEVFKPYSKEEILAKTEKKADNLLETYEYYTSDAVSEVIDYINRMSDNYDIDDNCYYDEEGYEMDYDNDRVDSIKQRDDIKVIDDELSLIAYAGFCDDSDLAAEDAPCIIIRTSDGARIGNGLFSFEHYFNEWKDYVSAPIYTGTNAEPKLAILNYTSNEYVTRDSFDDVKPIYYSNDMGWVAIVRKKSIGSNLLKADGTYLFKEWIYGSIESEGYGNLLLTDSDGVTKIVNSNGDTVVSDITNKRGDKMFSPFGYEGLFLFVKHTNGVINAYNRKTFEKFAPWDISGLFGIKNLTVRYDLPNGSSGGKHESFYIVVLTNGEKCLLDKNANIHDMNGKLVKSNPLLKESSKSNWIGESLNRYLSESRESKNMSLARRLMRDKKGVNEQMVEMTIDSIRNDIPNVRLADYKFMLGVTRLFLDNELADADSIMKINQYLKYLASNAHINEYDNNLNGYSFDKLDEIFGQVAIDNLNADKNDVASKDYVVNNDYNIIPIDTPQEAAKYSQYTDWCVTQDEGAYYTYTHGGKGRFYFCLKNGFENVEDIPSGNCPLDEYGLSMIAVSVNADGSCNTITCRWNHKNGGNDHIMTTKELSELIGRNFYEVFKPLTESEIKARVDKRIGDAINDFNNTYDDIYDAKMDNAVVSILQGSGGRYDNIDIGVYEIGDSSQYILIKSNSNDTLVWDTFGRFNFRRSGDIITAPSNADGVELIGMDGGYVTRDKLKKAKNYAELGYIIVEDFGGRSNVLVHKNLGRDVSNGWEYLFDEWLEGYLVLSRDCEFFILETPTNENNNLRRLYTLDGRKSISDVSAVIDNRFCDWLIVKKGKFYYFVDRKSFYVASPWQIREIVSSEYGLFKVRLKNNIVVDVNSRNLDIINPHDGQVMKKNPYFKEDVDENFKSLGNIIKESLNKLALDTF